MNIVECCWACHGSGFHLKSVQPVRFKPCWMCYGRRGRTADLRPMEASKPEKKDNGEKKK